MNGYIKNISKRPLYALKRHLMPDVAVSLDELYKVYGDKHGLEKGQPFADWLRQVKLPDEQKWEIHFEETEEMEATEEVEEMQKVTITAQLTEVVDGAERKEGLSNEEKAQSARPMIKNEWEVDDIVNLSVRQAREEIPKIRDKKTLSYALNVARQKPNKETVCNILEKRIDELRVLR